MNRYRYLSHPEGTRKLCSYCDPTSVLETEKCCREGIDHKTRETGVLVLEHGGPIVEFFSESLVTNGDFPFVILDPEPSQAPPMPLERLLDENRGLPLGRLTQIF